MLFKSFWYFCSRQPSFICPVVPHNAFLLFWYLDGIVFLTHHSRHHNFLEIYLDGDVKIEP